VRHAALAWAIDEWVSAFLTEEGRHRTLRALDGALVALEAEVCEVDPTLAASAGLPSASTQYQLLAEIRRGLFGGLRTRGGLFIDHTESAISEPATS
jgi:hypothetical protein